jgi:hypothetical protein
MTDEQIKEAISREFMRILAFGHGFKVIEASLDHGVDMTICPVSIIVDAKGRIRLLDSQFKLDFQLKSTTPASIIDDDDHIRYDLEAKTYNDLIHRRSEALPLHLVLVVLSETPPACLNLDAEVLGIVGKAYWYLPDEGAALTENEDQIRIRIPKANQVQMDFVPNRYQVLGIEL